MCVSVTTKPSVWRARVAPKPAFRLLPRMPSTSVLTAPPCCSAVSSIIPPKSRIRSPQSSAVHDAEFSHTFMRLAAVSLGAPLERRHTAGLRPAIFTAASQPTLVLRLLNCIIPKICSIANDTTVRMGFQDGPTAVETVHLRAELRLHDRASFAASNDLVVCHPFHETYSSPTRAGRSWKIAARIARYSPEWDEVGNSGSGLFVRSSAFKHIRTRSVDRPRFSYDYAGCWCNYLK